MQTIKFVLARCEFFLNRQVIKRFHSQFLHTLLDDFVSCGYSIGMWFQFLAGLLYEQAWPLELVFTLWDGSQMFLGLSTCIVVCIENFMTLYDAGRQTLYLVLHATGAAYKMSPFLFYIFAFKQNMLACWLITWKLIQQWIKVALQCVNKSLRIANGSRASLIFSLVCKVCLCLGGDSLNDSSNIRTPIVIECSNNTIDVVRQRCQLRGNIFLFARETLDGLFVCVKVILRISLSLVSLSLSWVQRFLLIKQFRHLVLQFGDFFLFLLESILLSGLFIHRNIYCR